MRPWTGVGRLTAGVLLTACLACGSEGGGGVPVIQQSNVHFDGCPTVAQSTETRRRAVATVHNVGAAGTSRQVFYFSLRGTAGSQQATCSPTGPSIAAGGTVELSCDITVPPNTVPADLALSGH